MALAPRLNRVSLSFMGEGWAEAYINFRMMKDGDQQEIDALDRDQQLDQVKKAITLLQMLFVSGKGLGEDGRPTDISLDDIASLDLWTINELVQRVGQEPDPKALKASSSTTMVEAANPIDLPDSSTESDLD